MGNQVVTESPTKDYDVDDDDGRNARFRSVSENTSLLDHADELDTPQTEAAVAIAVAASTTTPPTTLQTNPPRCLPLSTRIMGSLAGGIYCQECRTNNLSNNEASTLSFHNNFNLKEEEQDNENLKKKKNDDDDTLQQQQQHHDYDLKELARQNSQVISPLVLGPMLQPHGAGRMSTIEQILSEYMAACQFYGCGARVNAGILTTIRFSLPSLRVTGDFHDADMLALAEILLRHGNGPLRFIKRLDFSRSSKEGKLHGKAGFRSHGALTLSKILQQSEFIEEVRLEGNRLGPYGASAIFLACSRNSTLKRIAMRRCLIGERGGLAFAELLLRATKETCGLIDVDLSVNRIGFTASLEIEKVLMKRSQQGCESIYVDLEGNLVLQEVMNGCTHGLGIILAIVGAVLLSQRVRGRSLRHVISCAVYSFSLLMLYTSSTLYHSFFALQNTRYIFEVLDKCAIYILIAGSYTPFITIIMITHFHLQVAMLVFIWTGCLLGIYVEFYHPTWKHKTVFSLSMYLGMGWVAAFAPKDVVEGVPQGAINLIILGGVGYTTGVPFFLRNNFLDHSIWHLFVLTASMLHWAAVYFYLIFIN